MAKKKTEEVNKPEELKEKVVTETTEKEEITSTGETAEELVGEKTEASVEEEKQDAKVEENASNTEQDTEVQVTEENLTVKEVFKDRYDSTIIYNVGDVFIEDETLQNSKPVKAEKGKYKVSKERYTELKRSLYVD